MAEAEINGARHHFECAGSGGTPIFFVAGMGGAGHYWGPQLAHFSARQAVVSYDQRGTGRSAHVPVSSIEQLADDALALLDHLGLQRVHYVGHSTGGAIGQVLAAKAPERFESLTLYASISRADAFRSRIWNMRRSILIHQGTEAYARATTLALYPPSWIAENDARLAEDEVRSAASLPSPEIMNSRIDAILKFDFRDRLGDIKVPSLVVCAHDDALTPMYFSEEIAAGIPGAVTAYASTGAHALSRVTPEWFNATLERFWDSLNTQKPRV